jgi:hypothetical protein
MSSTTPFFQAFGPLLFGRAPRSPLATFLQKLRANSSLVELMAACGHFIPDTLLSPASSGNHSRQRHYSLSLTFYCFLTQVLSPGTSCREIVRRLQAWLAASNSPIEVSSETTAYCKARAKLPEQTLEDVASHLVTHCSRQIDSQTLWHGRRVKVVDGTTLSMPDTPENQALYPQPSSQKPGLGFPIMRLVGIFCLASGALVQYAKSNIHVHESLLFRRLWGKLECGDVLLADRGFCSFHALWGLAQHGIDCLMRLNGVRKTDLRNGKVLGPNDRLQTWKKPTLCPAGMSPEEFEQMPETLAVRVVKIDIATKGFRTTSYYLVTTLLDHTVFTPEVLAELYFKRWSVELRFREIKTTMSMDVLRCQCPHMINRELVMHTIAYNLVRILMLTASCRHSTPLDRLSFKGTLDTLRHWAPIIDQARGKSRKQSALIDEMIAIIAGDLVIERPGRSEPRAKKRRPKNYQLLTKPRGKMGHVPRRNRPKKSRRACPK